MHGATRSIFSLTYVSCAVQCLTPEMLDELLRTSRNHNARTQITGMLLYKEGNFVQVLEGSKTAVQMLYGTIACDTRHRGLIVLAAEYAKQRQFAEWQMAFRDVDGTESALPDGYSDFLNYPLSGTEFAATAERAQKPLLLFKERM